MGESGSKRVQFEFTKCQDKPFLEWQIIGGNFDLVLQLFYCHVSKNLNQEPFQLVYFQLQREEYLMVK